MSSELYQTELCRDTENVVLVFTSFAGVADRGLMKDEFHYYQAGYNEVGEEAAMNIASYFKTGVEPSFYDVEYDNTYVPNN